MAFIKAILFWVCLLFMALNLGGISMADAKELINNISFSADGKKILFDRNTGTGSRIHVLDLETNDMGVYESPFEEEWAMASYSNDGRRIVFSVTSFIGPRKDKRDFAGMRLATMNPDGSDMRIVTKEPAVRIYPSFSHSGEKIIFARAEDVRKEGKTPAAGYDVWELDLNSGVERRLTRFRFFEMSPPFFMPDDESFLFSAEFPTRFPGLSDNDHKAIEERRKGLVTKYGENTIYKMKTGQENLEPLIIFKRHSSRPELSADGARIFFRAQAYKEDGKPDWTQFFLYSPDGKHRRITYLMFPKGGSIRSAAASPDGERLAVVYGDMQSDDHKIALYRVQDTTSRQIVLPKQARGIN
jgi:Tol biopolymer transport system component